ncbi:survival motor neuron interacting protein 1-domain-containing protein [Umbelopsis sp. PMI_123]|nr:survival motor neuron interacting protein 1-domain-containing protein [Umbelopsis sp. PMI_123]
MAARRILTRTGNEDDEEQFSGKSILPVSFEKEIDDGFVPSTGEDYLLMVRRQTRRVPAVVVAAPPPETKKFSQSTLPSHYQFQVEQVTPTAENLLPNDAWRAEFRTRFDGFKESFSRQSKLPSNEVKLPTAKDKKHWKIFLYGAPKTEGSSDQGVGHQPYVNILQRITQDVVLRLLNWHIEWLEHNEIQKRQAMWMYALLTRLDKVMTSDETSILRNVSRKIIQIRQGQTDPESPQVAYLNILITIIATCFGQADLV